MEQVINQGKLFRIVSDIESAQHMSAVFFATTY